MAALDRRIGWIFVVFLALLALALIRAADLGVLKAGSLQQAAVSQQITRQVIPAARGTITDRNGVQLAISESADEVDRRSLPDQASAGRRRRSSRRCSAGRS